MPIAISCAITRAQHVVHAQHITSSCHICCKTPLTTVQNQSQPTHMSLQITSAQMCLCSVCCHWEHALFLNTVHLSRNTVQQAAVQTGHAHVAGQQPKRQRVTSAPDPTKAHLLMGQYLTGAIAFAPWEAMGMSKAPVLGGALHKLPSPSAQASSSMLLFLW